MSEQLPTEYVRELEEGIERAWEIALEMGLDPFPVHFEILPANAIYEIAGYGMPTRFSHWTHGKSYARQKIMYDYGLSKIYELIINTNPCRAFLLDTNTVLENKWVAAHCLGHSDFFKNNAYFAKTNRHMDETMGINADRIRQYEYEYGYREVESFLDAVLSIDAHIDPSVAVDDLYPDKKKYHTRKAWGPYDDLWHRDDDDEVYDRKRSRVISPLKPEKPVTDLLLFLHEFSPVIEDWERDIIQVVRQDALYFEPQRRTKVINEGWASFWHTRIMREMDLASEDYIDFSRLHASVVQPSLQSLNPYYLGFKILEDIEKRFGREKLFEVRETETDASLVRNYLTEELVNDLDLFLFGREEENDHDIWIISEKQWERVRDQLVIDFLTSDIPRITVLDADHGGGYELRLQHEWDGLPLDMQYARKTLEYIHRIWGRRVGILTNIDEDKRLYLTYDNDYGHLESAV